MSEQNPFDNNPGKVSQKEEQLELEFASKEPEKEPDNSFYFGARREIEDLFIEKKIVSPRAAFHEILRRDGFGDEINKWDAYFNKLLKYFEASDDSDLIEKLKIRRNKYKREESQRQTEKPSSPIYRSLPPSDKD